MLRVSSLRVCQPAEAHLLAWFCVCALVASVLLNSHAPGASAPTASAAPARLSVPARLAALPLAFIPNVGQTHAAVRYEARGLGGTLLFSPGEVVLEGAAGSGKRAPSTRSLHLRFVDANPAVAIQGAARQPGVVNFIAGSDPAQWHTGLPTYAGIVYQQLYPGTDLRYDGRDGQLKGTYTLAPGADPARIRWSYAGAQAVRVDAAGDLLVTLGAAGARQPPLTERAPLAWQDIGGRRVPVAVRYALRGDSSVGFALGAYNAAYALTIDPTLEYGTYLGGAGDDAISAITVDSRGVMYVAGVTRSTDLPTLPQQAAAGGADAFVTALSADGRSLLFSTYLGGSADDQADGLAVDRSFFVAVVGRTQSADFPTTVQAFDRSYNGGGDDFVVRLSADGTPVYSTYLGGSGADGALNQHPVAAGDPGQIYLGGTTGSTDFPVTSSAFQQANGGGSDAFIAHIDATQALTASLVYATYLGGSADDGGRGVAADDEGRVYLTGETSSPNFPTISALQTTCVVGTSGVCTKDAFVAKLDPTKSGAAALIYSTYFGGSGQDSAAAIAVDDFGAASITGSTSSNQSFPIANAFDPTYNPSYLDAFVAQLDPSGKSLRYSSYLGGSIDLYSPDPNGDDAGLDIALDGAGNAYVSGSTQSFDFPLVKPVQDLMSGSKAAFIAKVNRAGSRLLFSSYLGDDVAASGIAVDRSGRVYVAGGSGVGTIPSTSDAYQPAPRGGSDGFVARLNLGVPQVNQFTVDSGALASSTGQVKLNVEASTSGIGDVTYLLYIEYAYNPQSASWQEVARSNWLPYGAASADYSWKLQRTPGMHYLHVWAGDTFGNVSANPGVQVVNYLPPTVSIPRNEIQIYRVPLVQGQQLAMQMQSLTGNADLYAWNPDGSLAGSSETDNSADAVSITAAITGTYQVEVEGFSAATYGMVLTPSAALQTARVARPLPRGRGQPSVAPDFDPPTPSALPPVPVLLYLPLTGR